MPNKNDGGPAFPGDIYDKWGKEKENTGMSLRDYFAAKAMQGLLTNFKYDENGYAQSAYKIADAMLKAREE